jgi:hypothetical protein
VLTCGHGVGMSACADPVLLGAIACVDQGVGVEFYFEALRCGASCAEALSALDWGSEFFAYVDCLMAGLGHRDLADFMSASGGHYLSEYHGGRRSGICHEDLVEILGTQFFVNTYVWGRKAGFVHDELVELGRADIDGALECEAARNEVTYGELLMTEYEHCRTSLGITHGEFMDALGVVGELDVLYATAESLGASCGASGEHDLSLGIVKETGW